MIHVCFGLHDETGRYSKFTGTAILSIFKNTASEVSIHILHDNTLSADNHQKFLRLAEQYNQRVNFYNVEEICPREVNFIRDKLADKIESRFSIGAFYRLLAKKILTAQGVRRTIYLDSDVIVNLNIAELWQHDLKNFPLAAVPELASTYNHIFPGKFLILNEIVRVENYFCSGVMILELDRLGENFFVDGVQFLAYNPKCEAVDQDILNAFFSTNYFKLAQKFDSFVSSDRAFRYAVEKKIYHYAGHVLELDFSDGFNRLWFEYFLASPWFEGEIFARINDAIKESYAGIIYTMKNSLAHLSAVMNGKTRAFYLMSDNAEMLKKIFSIRDDEEIIFADMKNAIPNLVYAMGKSLGKKIFFIIVSDFDAVSKLLQQVDFIPDKDFLDGSRFVTTKKDVEFNLYPLIKAM